MLLDTSVVRDVADALDGRFDPATDPDPVRRERLVAAARLRMYGERDRSGWYVVTYHDAKRSAEARGDAAWSVGFLPDLSTFEDAPPATDVEALVGEYLHVGIDVEPAHALAYAVLYQPVEALVTEEPHRYHHAREFDLPDRLEILSSSTAFERFRIPAGEEPVLGPPPGSPLESGAHWWVP